MPPPISWSSDGPTNTQRQDLTLGQFTPETPRRHLSDLVVNAETERQLRTALAKVQYHKVLYEDWGLASVHPEGRGVALNLYGPPGTGKTFAAEALADYLQRSIIRIDYAQIELRFVGDTPKNIAAAFSAAHEANAVLFFDEADLVLSRRVTNITQAADYGVNVTRSTLLLQLDSVRWGRDFRHESGRQLRLGVCPADFGACLFSAARRSCADAPVAVSPARRDAAYRRSQRRGVSRAQRRFEWRGRAQHFDSGGSGSAGTRRGSSWPE